LRGNYADMTTDFTVTQQMTDYTADEQARWLRLVTRQLALIPTRACSEFIDAVAKLDMQRGILTLQRLTSH
jgi:phenylalanine-4-hydroxylase